MKLLLKLIETKVMRSLNARLATPTLPQCAQNPAWTDPWIKCALEYLTQSIFHHSGTCKMGPASDRMAVVDERLRVHGIERLRVIDASVMPTIVCGNINAAVIMIGEKGADMILDDHKFKWKHGEDEDREDDRDKPEQMNSGLPKQHKSHKPHKPMWTKIKHFFKQDG